MVNRWIAGAASVALGIGTTDAAAQERTVAKEYPLPAAMKNVADLEVHDLRIQQKAQVTQLMDDFMLRSQSLRPDEPEHLKRLEYLARSGNVAAVRQFVTCIEEGWMGAQPDYERAMLYVYFALSELQVNDKEVRWAHNTIKNLRMRINPRGLYRPDLPPRMPFADEPSEQRASSSPAKRE